MISTLTDTPEIIDGYVRLSRDETTRLLKTKKRLYNNMQKKIT